MTPFVASFLLLGTVKIVKNQEELKMVEFFVTKGKLVVRNSEPLIVVEGEERALLKEEFILWTSLHWNILNKESLNAEFDRRMKKYSLYGDVSFEQTLSRLKTRGLVASKSDYLAADALYNLVKDLYVVPLGTVSTFKKAMIFGFMLIDGIPLDKCREAMVKCADSMGITVQKTNCVLDVTLPMILPTKKKAKSEYLFEPLFFAMDKASKKENFFLKEKAMMCIEFIYDKNNKTIPRGDHDNKEVKQVIDAIAPFVVRDDLQRKLRR